MSNSKWELRQGDALALLQALPTGSVDAVITDPPYSSGGQFRGDRSQSTRAKYVITGTKLERPDFGGDNRDQRSFLAWCGVWLGECLRVAKPGAPICVFTDWRQLPITTDAVQAGGWIWRGIVPWSKTEAARPSLGRFRAQCEYVVWGSAGPLPASAEVGALPGFFERAIARSDKHHQTGKPTEIMREIVRICPPGGLVLDPFAGSGTTGVGALLEGRRFLGFELGSEYADVARNRLRDAEAQAMTPEAA